MNLRYITLLVVVVALFAQCKKDPEETYSNDRIMLDNAMAASYFHTVFREAENAWALVDSMKYVQGTYHDPASKPIEYKTKTITYDDASGKVTVTYSSWLEANQSLIGTIYFNVAKNAYQPQSADIPSVITVHLIDFSINQQSVTGSCRIQYSYVADSESDHYACTFLDGSAIYEAGANMPVIITGATSNGKYERIKGGQTYTQKDDEWTYSSTVTGMLYDDPNMKYTNTVLPGYIVNGEERSGALLFAPNCTVARQGASQIKIMGRPDIVYFYECSGVYYESTNDAD
jgi:hypothetical protein